MNFDNLNTEPTQPAKFQYFRPVDIQKGPRDRDRSEAILTSSPVFVIGDSFYRSRTPRSIHWSVAWSDLMMTMFILFLTLFVYQVEQREFINENSIEVVSGSTISIPSASQTFPIVPIAPGISSEKADALKRTEPITVPVANIPADSLSTKISITRKEIITKPPEKLPSPDPAQPEVKSQQNIAKQEAEKIVTPPVDDVEYSLPMANIDREIKHEALEPRPLANGTNEKTPVGINSDYDEIISDLYDLSRYTVQSEKLEKFASVELIPDKTVRIILTGDLLFESGQAELTSKAKISLQKLSKIIEKTPYMINVNGHSDTIPIHSKLYPTNWELSVARASRVARFLMKDTGVPGSQFRVSGFSYYHPLKPNTTASNRAINRRVEIIISKEPAQADSAAL